MRDIIQTDGFVHIPPRERLRRHAVKRIVDRLGWRPTLEEYEDLCSRAREFKGTDISLPTEPRETQLWVFRGKKVRVVYDRTYDAVVTILLGWESPSMFRWNP